jgi:steroid 5-alpha reductase family enzyme
VQIVHILVVNALVCSAAFVLLWAVCLRLKDVTVVDAYWAVGMGVLATATFLQFPDATPRRWLLLGLCWLWALRLGGYLFWRWRDHGSDRRYRRMMEKAKEERGWGFAKATLILVFAVQAPLQFLVALPVQLGQIAAQPLAIGAAGWAGAMLALFGIGFESIADLQLTRFRRQPANAGRVLRTGLWKYTRHPNYFGDACTWWGLFLIAAETRIGLLALVGPLLLSWLLVKWSGVPTLEYRMRKTRPDYADYIATTSSLVPWPPRKTQGSR